jgi:hypothetical protein
MVRAAVQRLENLKDPRTLKNTIPENLQQTLLDIFQTTSDYELQLYDLVARHRMTESL